MNKREIRFSLLAFAVTFGLINPNWVKAEPRGFGGERTNAQDHRLETKSNWALARVDRAQARYAEAQTQNRQAGAWDIRAECRNDRADLRAERADYRANVREERASRGDPHQPPNPI